MEVIDETILNDENDEDLDYDLDPKEENALLQEEADFLEQELEDEDVLDINVDYDQMDVTDVSDKVDSASSDKSKSEKTSRKQGLSGEKTNNLPIHKNEKSDKLKSLSRVQKRGNILGGRTRRSKTVLINPRFKGPVQVNGRQLAWETPPPILNETQKSQQYIQPWSSGLPGHMTIQPQQQIPVNNFNSAPFVPNNSYMYMQQHQQQIIQPQPFVQPQVFMNPPPLMNQLPLLNHNMITQQPPMQMDHCINNFQSPPMSRMETIQQIPEPPKLPVHQRLGIPMNNMNQSPSNDMSFDNNQHFHQERIAYENLHSTNFGQPRSNNLKYSNKKFDNLNNTSFNRKQGYNNNGNNKLLMSARKSNNNIHIPKSNGPKLAEQKETTHSLKKESNGASNIVVVPEDEDEETRQYRIKIEEQKRKREEVLRKKEENRLKNLSDVNNETATKVVPKLTNHPVRTLHQKKFNHYQHRPQQNYQFVKTQVNSNNIVITGNDDQCHNFNSRQNKITSTCNRDFSTVRIVTAAPISSSNVNSKTAQNFDKEVDTESLSSFLSDRIVSTQENLIQTNIVVVKNLATATTKPKIMKLCRGIGNVQKLQMETNERQATIHFDTVASAQTFYNKYRRYMIDLSVIQVDLVPCEGSS